MWKQFYKCVLQLILGIDIVNTPSETPLSLVPKTDLIHHVASLSHNELSRDLPHTCPGFFVCIVASTRLTEPIHVSKATRKNMGIWRLQMHNKYQLVI